MLIRHLYQKSASGVEKICLEFGEFLLDFFGFDVIIINTRPVGQAVKTPPFHGGNRGSIPLGVTKNPRTIVRGFLFIHFLLKMCKRIFGK